MTRNPIVFQNGTLVSNAKVEVGGTIYDVTPAEYEGTTPLSANNLNQLQTNIYDYVDESIDETNTLLWTNSNPNTSFPSGTVSISGLSNYDDIEIFGKNYASSSYINVTSVKIPKGYNGYLNLIEVDGAVVNRQVTVNWNSNSITFNDAKFKPATSTAVASNDNNRAIPIYIVGHKTNVFE